MSECYAYRGVDLEEFNYYEYVSHIEVIQINEKTNSSEIKSVDTNNINTNNNYINDNCGAGRPSSSQFSFVKSFPMAVQYTQRLRAKPLIPTFAGMRPARHPGIFKDNDQWRKLALDYGKFYSSIFIPWSITHVINTTYEHFCDWAKHTEKTIEQNPLTDVNAINYSRFEHVRFLCNITNVNHHARSLINKFRNRNADKWIDLPETDKPKAPNYGDNSYEKETENDTLPEFIKLLADSAANGPSTKLDKRRQYLNEKMNNLNDLFTTEHITSPQLINNTNSAGYSTDNLTHSMDLHIINDIDFFHDVLNNLREDQQVNQIDNDYSSMANNIVHNQIDSMPNQLTLKLTLNKEQQIVFDYVFNTTDNVFVHGGPGVGKTHTINTISALYPSGKIKIVASTGTASTLLTGSQTIHSALCLGINDKANNTCQPSKLALLRQKFNDIDTLIIDEISMVSTKLFNTINGRLQLIKGNYKFKETNKLNILSFNQ